MRRAPRSVNARRGAVALLTGAIVLAPASAALAHAYLERAEPPPYAELDKPPVQLKLLYSEPLERDFVELSLTRDGQPIATDQPRVDADGKTVRVRFGHSAPGDYAVHWRLVSKDGHRTEGVVEFKLRAR